MDSTQVNTLLIRAKKLHQQNKLSAAKTIYEQILQHFPTHPDVNHLAGILHNQLKQPDEAIQFLTKAITYNPLSAPAYHNLGIVYKEKGDLIQAISCYEKALAINPSYYKVIHKMASAYSALGNIELATQHFEKVIAMMPDYAEAWQDYGIHFITIRRYDKAKYCFEKALHFNPELATAYLGLGNIYAEADQFEKAIECYQKALQIKPDYDDVYAKLARINDQICDWHHLSERQKKLLAITRQQIATHEPTSLDPFSALVYDWKAEDLAMIAKNFADTLTAQTKQQPKINFNFENRNNSRLKVGYISSAFYNHPTSYLAYNLFNCHQRQKFEIFLFSLTSNTDNAFQQHFTETAEHFFNVHRLTDQEIAQKIYSCEIDILIDLDGYIRNSRPGICAFRPAPIQASYLGFPGTLGASFFDYMLVDNIVVTPQTATTYIEKLIYLPNSYQVNNNKQLIANTPLTRSQYHLPENAFVFCCFNNSYKIEPKIFAVWMKLLLKIPDAVLWLFSNSSLTELNLQKEAKKAGVDPQRLIFAKREEKTLHLARHRLADLFLDTLYYNAHTTASDALWAGLPVLTCPQENFPSRVSASLLTAIGLPELIKPTLDDYYETAVSFYEQRDLLAKIRLKLQENLLTQPLFDTERFVTNLEQAYETMWQIYQSGQLPQTIHLLENYANTK